MPIAALTAALIALGLALPSISPSGLAPNTPAKTEKIKCHFATAAKTRTWIKRVWPRSRWDRGKPKPTTIAAYRHKLRCAAGPGHRRAMRKAWKRYRLRFGRYRALRLIAPYPGGDTWWSIPYYIVACESGGSWSAYNPSGALGPYQLLGWGAPFPVTSWHDKMAHHHIARDLWLSYGSSPWVCSG